MTSFHVCHGYALTIACKGENSLRLQNRRFFFFFSICRGTEESTRRAQSTSDERGEERDFSFVTPCLRSTEKRKKNTNTCSTGYNSLECEAQFQRSTFTLSSHFVGKYHFLLILPFGHKVCRLTKISAYVLAL